MGKCNSMHIRVTGIDYRRHGCGSPHWLETLVQQGIRSFRALSHHDSDLQIKNFLSFPQ
jgi:hypothetical protein